jgi:predicted MFS family arabinose efflux permease
MTSHHSPGRFNPWVLVALLWVVALLNYVDRQVIFSVLPLVRTDLKLSDTQLGLLSGSFFWVYAILSPFTGFLADRFGRRRAILLSLIVWSLVTWATGYAESFFALISARALMGISESCYLPAALALIAAFHGPRSRSRATGIHQSGFSAGIILGGFGGAWLGVHYGWRLAFKFLGAIGILYTVALVFLLHESPSRSSEKEEVEELQFLQSVKKLFALPGYKTMTMVFTTSSIASVMAYTWLPFFLYERFQMSLTEAGFVATFYPQSSIIVGMLLGGWISDQWSQHSTRGRVLTQAVGLLGTAPFLFLVGFSTSKAILIGSLILHGILKGLYDCNQMPVLCQVARNSLRSTGYGIFILVGVSSAGSMAVLAGYYKQVIGLSGALEIAAGLLFVSGLLLLRIRFPKTTLGLESTLFSESVVSDVRVSS